MYREAHFGQRWVLRRGGRVCVIALASLSYAPLSAAAAPSAGCQPGRPAVAHHTGGVALVPQPPGAPIPCLTTAGITTDSATVAVTPHGTVLYAPISTEFPGQVPAPADNAFPTGVARTTDDGAQWRTVIPDDDASDSLHQHIGLIPWMYSDPTTGRIWYATPGPAICGAMISWSDDGGLTWKDNDMVGCPGQGGMTVFEGPAPAGSPAPVGYPHVVYYCANLADNGPHLMYCYKSLDGGTKFTQVGSFPNSSSPPPSCEDTLDSPRGRVVAPDGTIYFVVDRCSEGMALATSHDEGDTWKQTPITSTPDLNLPVTSLAVDGKGTLYLAYTNANDQLPYLTVSSNRGATWTAPVMVGAPHVNLVDARTVAVAVDRPGDVSIAYSGSTDGGHTYDGYLAQSTDAASPGAIWWSAVVNNPAQPLGAGAPSTVYGDRDWFSTVAFAPDGTPWAGFQCAKTPFCDGQRVGMVGHLARARPQPAVLPKVGACYSRRTFAIRLQRPARHVSIRAARVSVADRPMSVRRRSGRWVAEVVLRKRTRGTVHVVIVETGSDGLHYQQTRTYHPCRRRVPN